MGNEFGKKVNYLLQQLYDTQDITCDGDALDIGCANGANSIWLAEKGFNVVGIDKFLPAELADHNDVKFLTTSVTDFNFQPDFYSLIIAANILQFLIRSEKYKILASIEKSLKVGGIFICESFTVEDESYKESVKRDSYGSYFELGELEAWAKKCGFEVVFSNEKVVKDNHAPMGEHSHGIVSLIIKKNS